MFGLGIGAAVGDVAAASIELAAAVGLGLVVIEALTVACYLWRRNNAESASSVRMIARGALAPYFWVGVVGIGLLAPLALCAYSLKVPSAAGLIVIGVTGLCGNAILKYMIVAAGRPRSLDVAGEAIPAPAAARMTVSQYMEGLASDK